MIVGDDDAVGHEDGYRLDRKLWRCRLPEC
jgi:hypothetical protein